MAVGVIVELPGGTREMYDFVCERMGFPDQWVPEALISHSAGPSADGWRVIDVWRSREEFEQEIPPRIGPGIAAFANEMGIEVEPPEIEIFELANLWSRGESLSHA